ncbi:MAG: FHA domain-containing protein [Polyangiales bacterium]
MKWELVSSLGHTTLTVGSNSDCTWVVRAEGVRPIHFSLHWDGGTLRAADVYSAGDVRVDGQALTSQWKPLLGRTRLEFGRAAMVVEASAGGQPKSGDHPLESIPAAAERKPISQRSGKETLIGVAPHMITGLVTPRAGESSSPPPGQSSPAGPSSSRPPVTTPSTRPQDRSMKATLVGGIGISPVPTPLSQPAANPKANATLVGFSPTEAMRGQLGGLGGPDQRTAQQSFTPGDVGAPTSPVSSPTGRRMTQKGMISQPPGVMPEAVSQAPVRNVAAAEPSARINSAWQEKPDEGMGGRTLRGMSQPTDAADPDFVPRAPRMPSGSGEQRWGDLGDRLSDIPTQMRDPASFESRRPRRGFPWRYVGVLLLTGVAYFAWLYLLDHM